MSIKFSLICECTAKFEGWFPTNEDYDNQLASGQLLCPMCDSTKVRKDIMAPSLTKKSNQKTKSIGEKLMMSGRARQILKQVEQTIKKEYTDVGKQFPEEARKAVKGKRDEKFYGTATKKELKELKNEGIDIFKVPEIKDN
jgi:hypothetical protein